MKTVVKFSVLGFVGLMGCVPVQEIEISSEFSATEAAIINKPGSGVLNGEAFLKRRDGQVVTCAGEMANLVPATSYAVERITAIYGSPNGGYRPALGANYDDGADEYQEMIRQVRCDSEGRFTFKGVASGTYYISTSVLWQVSDYYYEGGVLAQRVKIEDGKMIDVVLSS